MAESPLFTLGRILGGVVLMQGRLGHQVLGQLLVTNTNEVAVAAAFVVIAGTTGQRSAVGQMMLRTVAPALAGRVLLNSQEQRVDRKLANLEKREERFDAREREVEDEWKNLENDNRALLAEVDRLRALVPPPALPLSSPQPSPSRRARKRKR